MDTLTGQRSGFPAHQLELTLRLGQLSGTQVQLNQIAVCDQELRVEHQRARCRWCSAGMRLLASPMTSTLRTIAR